MITRLLFLMSVNVFISTFAIAQNDYSMFIGEYKINLEKSQSGKSNIEDVAPTRVQISVVRDTIILKRTFQKSRTIIDSLIVDGRYRKKDIISNNSKTEKMFKTNAFSEKKEFIVNSIYKVVDDKGSWHYDRVETYSFFSAAHLSIKRQTKGPDRTEDSNAFYDKL